MNRIEKLIADNYRWIVLLSFMQLVMNGFLLYVLSK